MESSVAESPRRQPACPCCVFLKEDLFLPSTLSTSDSPPEENNSPVISPQEALNLIQQYADEEEQRNKSPILLVDTHNHAHLKRERHETYRCDTQSPLPVVSLSLAVEPADWPDAPRYSAADSSYNKSGLTLMGFGIHPWYLSSDTVSKNSEWKQKLEDLLLEHPSAVVGEIGLCKMARCARNHPEGKARGFEIQREILQEQLQVAVRHNRPVSVHCVQQHGVFRDILNGILEQLREQTEANPFQFVPPAIAMHSFTGTAHHVKQLLQWEASLFGEGPNDKKKKKEKMTHSPDDNEEECRSRRPLIYFGFSHIVNYEMCTSEKSRKQGQKAVRAVPMDRLLAESDVHHPEDVAAGTAGAIAYMAWALGQPMSKIASITAKNGLEFLQSHLSPKEQDGCPLD